MIIINIITNQMMLYLLFVFVELSIVKFSIISSYLKRARGVIHFPRLFFLHGVIGFGEILNVGLIGIGRGFGEVRGGGRGFGEVLGRGRGLVTGKGLGLVTGKGRGIGRGIGIGRVIGRGRVIGLVTGGLLQTSLT
jgi:hypothetical protein